MCSPLLSLPRVSRCCPPALAALAAACSTDKCVIASAGCQVDMKALQKLLQARNVMFQHNHGTPMSCKAAAQLLSNTLYYKRFFPYYTFNLCAGLDDEGEQGCLQLLQFKALSRAAFSSFIQGVFVLGWRCPSADLPGSQRQRHQQTAAALIRLDVTHTDGRQKTSNSTTAETCLEGVGELSHA